MKKLIFGVLLLVFVQVPAQTWTPNHLQPGNVAFSDINFPLPNVGFACGYGQTLLRTTNAGQTWISVPIANNPEDMEFPTPLIGYICGENGMIKKTMDAGATWINQVSGSPDHFVELFFLNKDTGYVLGYNASTFVAAVRKTVNGGLTWSSTGSLGTTNTCMDVYFLSADTGFITAMGGTRLFSTINGGVSWTDAFIGPGTGAFDITFISTTTGFVVGNDGIILKSIDRGLTWTSVLSPTVQHLRGITFTDPLNGWIVGVGGTMLRTYDGGINWIPVSSFTSNDIFSICMLDPIYGWCGTFNGWTFGGSIFRFGAYSVIDSSNVVRGNIFADQNSDCISDPTEIKMENWIVKATPGPYYALTDTAGNYKLELPTGTFNITQVTPQSYGVIVGQTCALPGYSISFNSYNNDTTGFNFGDTVTYCPYLFVNVASDRRRRCFRNHTVVNYFNTGYANAPNVQVVVDFPKYVIPVSSSIPWTLNGDSNYVFQVGNIAAQTSGSIHIIDSVVCWIDSIRGMTQCTEAWIVPANTCPPPSSLWDGSDIEVKAKCLFEGFVHFTIINLGAAMSDSSEYRLFKNNQLVRTKNYKLGAGDSIHFFFQAYGFTFRVEADQRPFHPWRTESNATVEACSLDSLGNLILGYHPQLPHDDEDPVVSIHCLDIRDSYDPNEKKVSPEGITSFNYVDLNQELHFHIGFQNTGTDTAFNISIIDTLSPYLDPSTFRMGTSSHPVTFDFVQAPLLTVKFDFDNILLPDSTTNEFSSHGFVDFYIKPDTSISSFTVIENFSDIYFDFNLPVRTDTAYVTCYDTVITGNFNGPYFSEWPMIIGPDTVCAGDTVFFYAIGENPIWWSALSNPSDTIETGSFLDTALSGQTVFIAHTPNGTDTIFVSIISCSSSINENILDGSWIYFDEVSEILYMDLKMEDKFKRIAIYDMNGRMLIQKKPDSSSQSINFLTFSSGMYLVFAETFEGRHLVRKLSVKK
jgi:uncharacterized repeat protein (TIGR01451 family)